MPGTGNIKINWISLWFLCRDPVGKKDTLLDQTKSLLWSLPTLKFYDILHLWSKFEAKFTKYLEFLTFQISLEGLNIHLIFKKLKEQFVREKKKLLPRTYYKSIRYTKIKGHWVKRARQFISKNNICGYECNEIFCFKN